MIAHAHATFGRAPYLAASTASPQTSSKPRLSRSDLVLHVGENRISFNVVEKKKSTRPVATRQPTDPQALASFIHARFLATTSAFPEDFSEVGGCRVNLDEVPETGALIFACSILGGLGYIARPEGDAPHSSVWVEYANY